MVGRNYPHGQRCVMTESSEFLVKSRRIVWESDCTILIHNLIFDIEKKKFQVKSAGLGYDGNIPIYLYE